jgi:predicted hydrolase (HD superfamily)
MPDMVGGSAGWVGAGLLGLVLAWLFGKHLPSKDAQIERLLAQAKEQLAAKDTQLREQLTAKDSQLDTTLLHKWAAIEKMSQLHHENLKTLSTEFKAAVEALAAHCEKAEMRLVTQLDTSRDEFLQVMFNKNKVGPGGTGD